MKHDHSPAVLQVLRYGLPLVILVFYISASWNFSYTPDSTFFSLRMAASAVAGGTPESLPAQPMAASNPLWVLLLVVAETVNLDLLLAAKIFSLFFSSLAVLLTYLLATELLRDRFLAFCSALAFATSGLLLQAAPAGSALPLALTLVLAALFFMLRNDYLVSAFMLGMATLTCWQAAGGVILLLLDAWLNSSDPVRRVRLILLCTVVYVLSVVPWFLFVALRTAPPVPWLLGLNDFPGSSLVTIVASGIPAVIGAGAAVGLMRHKNNDEPGRLSHLVAILWACWFLACSVLWERDFFLMALAILVVYAVSVVHRVTVLPRSTGAYAQALLLTGGLILLHQLAFNVSTRPAIVRTEEASEELTELAYWIKNGVPEEASVSSEHPEILIYYSGRSVKPWEGGSKPSTEFVVSAQEEVWGYEVVHRASMLEGGELLSGAGHFAVWRLK